MRKVSAFRGMMILVVFSVIGLRFGARAGAEVSVDDLYKRLTNATNGKSLFGICQNLCSEDKRGANMTLESCYDRCYVQILAPIWFGSGVEPAPESDASLRVPGQVSPPPADPCPTPAADQSNPGPGPKPRPFDQVVVLPECKQVLKYETTEKIKDDDRQIKMVGKITNTSDYFSVADASVRINIYNSLYDMLNYFVFKVESPDKPLGPGESRPVLIDVDTRHETGYSENKVVIEGSCRILMPK